MLDDAVVLERCLRALERQDLAPTEVVVVDNGSSDASVEIARRHGAIIALEPQAGIAAAASHGYDVAAGDLILRLDADSTPPSDWVARVVAALDADPGLDALSGPGEFVAMPSLLRRALTGWYWHVYFHGLRTRVGAAPLFGSNLAMRSSAWRMVSGAVHRADRMIHDDLDLSIHLVQAGARIEVAPGLRVPVSARPLLHPFGMASRFRRARHTLALHADPRSVGARLHRRAPRRVRTASDEPARCRAEG